jgi:excisionase family DNA binding protein
VATDRRLPPAPLVRSDGAVVIPPGEAREVLRLVLIGVEARVRADGGEVSPQLRRILYALHDASQLKDDGPAAGAGSGSAAGPPGRLELSVGQAAKLLGCSPRWVRQLVLAGRLTGRRAGSRTWLIDPTSLDDYRHGGTHEHDEHRHGPAGAAGRAG